MFPRLDSHSSVRAPLRAPVLSIVRFVFVCVSSSLLDSERLEVRGHIFLVYELPILSTSAERTR